MPGPDAPEPETTTTYRVQMRTILTNVPPYPWHDAPGGDVTREQGLAELARWRAANKGTTMERTEFRLVKITTEVCE